MIEWYYAKDGQQNGPITFEKLVQIANTGGLDAKNDLVWNASMKDWTPAGQVAGIFNVPANPLVASDPSNPYSTPQSTWTAPTLAQGESLAEIVPGSDPLDAMACIKRGLEIAKRNAGTIAIVFVVYFAITMGVGMVQGLLDVGLNIASSSGARVSNVSDPSQLSGVALAIFTLSRIVSQVFSLFLGLGLCRIGLNLASGKEASVGMLFGEGNKLLRAIGATILFYVAFIVGLILFVVPGIYIALRYGLCMVAIVDRDMGIMEAFSYSSSITTNNRVNIFVFWLLTILVMLAGFLALCVGIFIAMPIVWMASMIVYRWMQYGHRAAMDHPSTQTPMLSSL